MMKEVVIFVVLSRKLSRDILPGVVLEQESFCSHRLSHRMFMCI